MAGEIDPVEELLASVADGKPVDWDSALRGGGPAGKPRVVALREIAHIADFNRGLQRGAEGAALPERWGALLLLERLGEGARAEVFRAWDPELRREVALKLMRPAARGGADDEASLLDEGRAAARIRHPHVVTIYGIERHDGRVGLSMELLSGTTLEQEVTAKGPLDAATVMRLGDEIGSALAAVHAGGLLHRDIKPANVIRDASGRYVLADFGLGLRAGNMAVETSGTPMYMAPETLAGAAPTERSDLYSLGLLLWFALTGRHPFEVATLAERVAAASQGPPPLRTLCPGAPAALAGAIERAIAPDPRQRPAGVRRWASELEGAGATRSGAASRSAWPLLAGVGVVVVLAIATYGVWRSRQSVAPETVAAPATDATTPVAPTTEDAAYTVEASFLRRDDRAAVRLAPGDRVKPGDRLSLEVRATRPVWMYVLNEDEHGERYLLFPQPRFDTRNPIAADSGLVLPGTIDGRENAWTVTSAGGREHFLVVASPKPVAELEADLASLPAPRPDAPIAYAPVGEAAVERLRGVGGVATLAPDAAKPAPRRVFFERFRELTGRESDVHGVWVRQIVLENPR